MEMEKLELKYIAPYLPYELKYARVRVSPVSLSEEIELIGVLSTNGNAHNINKNVLCDYTSMRYFPILRPLSYIKQFEDIMDEFSEYSWETFENHFFVLGRSLNCFDSIKLGNIL
jgi:hypothetical protein